MLAADWTVVRRPEQELIVRLRVNPVQVQIEGCCGGRQQEWGWSRLESPGLACLPTPLLCWALSRFKRETQTLARAVLA